jgi:hypothetical protein
LIQTERQTDGQTEPQGDTREAWLRRASAIIGPEVGAPAALHVSMGFPKGSAGKRKAIGQCWNGRLSADKAPHIFISPELDGAAPVLAVLVHELIHAGEPNAGHKGAFITKAKAVGLVKPWTATSAGPELAARLETIAAQLGPFPHAPLAVADRGRKGSRLRLWECACPVKVRVASDEFNATCGECDSPFERQ